MKKFILALAAFLGMLTANTAFAQDWSGAVNITAITMTPSGDFTLTTSAASNPGSCNNVYRVYVNYMSLTTFGLEMQYKQAVAALVSGKKVSIFRSSDVYCYVGFIQLNAN